MEVFIDKCTDYKDTYEVIEEAFSTLGGIDDFIKDGETILVKPNLLKGSPPKEAVATHPDFIISVIKNLEKKDVDIIVGDSPAGRMSPKKLRKHYEKRDWLRIEDETSARLNYDVRQIRKNFPAGRVKKSFDMLKLAQDVDGIINLPKLKTHSLTVFTGAVKNQYGLVHGLSKAAYHGQFLKLNEFGRMLLDVNGSIKSRISIMDGILGMEGNGPSGGKPVSLNSILASKDPIACDYAACKMVGIPMQKVPTLIESDMDFDSIEYPKRRPSSFERDIEYPTGGSQHVRVPNFLANLFSNLYLDRPKLQKEKCVKCWECEEICPKDAISRKDHGPKISWWTCIRCYCCAEGCPEEALVIEQ